MIKVLLIQDYLQYYKLIADIINESDFEEIQMCGTTTPEELESTVLIHKPDILISNIHVYKEHKIDMYWKNHENISFVLIGEKCNEEELRFALSFCADGYYCIKHHSEVLKILLNRVCHRLEMEKSNIRDRKRSILLHYLEKDKNISVTAKNNLFQQCDQGDLFQVTIIRMLVPYHKNMYREDDNLAVLKGIQLFRQSFKGVEKYLSQRNGIDLVVLFWGSVSELKDNHARMKNFMDAVKETEERRLRFAVWIAEGEMLEKNTDLPENYQMVKRLLRERFFYNSIDYINKECIYEENGEIDNTTVFCGEILRSAKNKLELMDEDGIRNIFMQLKSNVKTSQKINGQDLLSIYKAFVVALLETLDRFHLEYEKEGMDYYSMIREYEYYWNIEDVFDTLCSYYLQGIHLLRAKEEATETVEIILAKKYIREYSDMEITLTEISEHVGMNPSYFSDYFKKNTGITFKQYLTEIRINHAKQLLLRSDMSLDDIAETVGFSDKKYFSRVFKKKMGCTPGEYRKNRWISMTEK